MDCLYVCHFSNGHIKVGRSISPLSRIAAHADRVGCLGVELVEHAIFECAGSSAIAELQLIQQCRELATANHKYEWFAGLDFDTAVDLAKVAAAIETVDENPCPAIERAAKLVGSKKALADALGITKAAVGQWTDKGRCVPFEHCPWIESLTSGQVLCEELRPDQPWTRIADATWPHPDGRPVLDFKKDRVSAVEA